MQQFRYDAVGANGAKKSGEISASSAFAAEQLLAEQSLFPTRLEVVEGGKARSPKGEKAKPVVNQKVKTRGKVKADEVTDLLRSIMVMLESGVPIAEGLQAVMENSSSPRVEVVAGALRADIMSGRSFAQAMARQPETFQKIVVDMVSVSDEGGRMAETLRHVIEYLDRQNTVKRNIIAAMVYPSILMGASAIAFLALIVVILPTFNEAFSSLGVKLPWYTMMLLHIGQFIKGNFIFCVLGIFGAVFGFKRAMKTEKFANFVQGILIRLPVIGPIITAICLNRSLRTLGSLLQTSVAITQAIQYAGRVSNHVKIGPAYQMVSQRVEGGSSLSEAMTMTKQFPKLTVQMVAVGERSGKVAELLLTNVEHTEAQTERKIKGAVSMLEPLVIIGMGIVIGAITMSILMPLFTINNSIK
jgi:type II secretory pathway component PulF